MNRLLRVCLVIAVCSAKFFDDDPEVQEIAPAAYLSCLRHGLCFKNWHKSIDVGGYFDRLLQPENAVFNGLLSTQSEEFRTGLASLQEIADNAMADGRRIRAYGSKWSVSEIAFGKETLVNTQRLTYAKFGLDNETHVDDSYMDNRGRLAVVQAGVHIRALNYALADEGLALTTTGAGDGQRFAGALQTGTHGSANKFGSMQEFCKAIHLVIPGESVLIQRASDPTVTQEFAEWIGATRLVNDDALFRAAVVGLGSMGLVHAYVIETEPLYELRKQTIKMSYDKVKPSLDTLDMTNLGFVGIGSELPWHFDVGFNAYRLDKHVYVRVFEKIPLSRDEIEEIKQSGDIHREPEVDADEFRVLDEAFSIFMGLLPSSFLKRRAYGRGLTIPMDNYYGVDDPVMWVRRPYEFFQFKSSEKPYTDRITPGTTSELSVPADRLSEALQVVFDNMRQRPIPCMVASRYVKGTDATLGFTKYNMSATINFNCPYTRVIFRTNGRRLARIYRDLERKGIPHTYHWGKRLPVNSRWVRNAYGTNLDEWKQVRSDFLGDAIDIFSNELIEGLGLYP